MQGLGAYPGDDPQFLGMLGMHGTFEANNAMHDCDLMINIGARFDDRITGKVDEFSPGSKKIHVDIDPSSIGKNIKVELYYYDKNDKKTLMSLAQKLRQILFGFKAEVEKNHISFSPDAFDENSVAFRKKNMPMFYGLYRMIGHTRDIIMGKGEYTLAYLQIAVWYEFYPEAAMYALERCVHPPPCDYEGEKQGSSKSNSHSHQYGSWKDIKYFCQFLMVNHSLFKFKEEMTPEHPLIDRSLKLMVHQIKDDEGMHKAFFITSNGD